MHDHRNRERALERLLPQAFDEPSAGARSSCLDAETLAAWTSGTLRTSEADQVETHVADCARCQSLLGTFVRTAPPAAAHDSLWARWHVRWLVPLATAATAVALYLLVPGLGTPPSPEQTVILSDSRRDAPASTQESATTTPSAPAATAPAVAEPLPTAPRALAAPAPMTTQAQEGDRPAQQVGADRRRESQDRLDAAPSSPAATAESRAIAPPPMREAAGAAPTPREEMVTEAPAAGRVATAPLATPAAPAPAAPAAGGVAGERRNDAALSVRRQAVVTIDIPTPTASHRFRIVNGERVERTTTGGQSWEVLARRVPGEMTAGSAPSNDVCWVVGRAGAVWHTTDGQLLARVPFPEPLDLVRVAAESALTATVTAASGRTFRTTDGGRTWQ